MDRQATSLRLAGSAAADAQRLGAALQNRKDKAESLLPSDGALPLQASIRSELERQTRQLEETLAKQARVALDRNEKHSREVQGVAAAWQLVARTLGEQLQAGFKANQRCIQDQSERLDAVEMELRRTLQELGDRDLQRRQEVLGVSETWQTLARTIGDQLAQVQRRGLRLETGLQQLAEGQPLLQGAASPSPKFQSSQPQPLSDKSDKPSSEAQSAAPSPVSPKTCEEDSPQHELPGALAQPVPEEEEDAPQSPQSPAARSSSGQLQKERSKTRALARSSTLADEEGLTFAEMQKQYGVKGKMHTTFVETEDSRLCPFRRWCIAIVAHRRFEMVCASLVILCAAMIGIEVDYDIQNQEASQHPVFRGLDIAFNTWFTIELTLRWTSEGCFFFSCENPSVKWNYMDCVLVGSSLLEEVAALLAAASFLEVSALRMLRMMRLVRIARVVRMLRFFSDLRVMVNGIMGSTKPLLWAFVFLLILMFMVGVTFMQLASNYMKETASSAATDDLVIYWGSLSRTMMTLYMAISGGVDWQDCVAPLRMVSDVLEYMFATYVFFTLFCCLNIVTGIFVDNAKALKGADEDAMYLEAVTERKRWIAEVKDLFVRLAKINGHFTLEDFKEQIYNIKVQTLFRKLGINLDGINAEELWEILDADQSGCIDEEEFAKGLKFFQGPAQSIHVYRLMREGAKLHDKVENLTGLCNQILAHQKV